MNALMLNEGLNVALRPKTNESGIVGGEEVARVVNALVKGEDGEKVRQKMKGFKEAAPQKHYLNWHSGGKIRSISK
ncbi:hypothetical protein RHMOL_Rhmol07G0041100 [Rhododendron molle]|uniref:Uncharacterized protein n=1 Tax=Rhododendron molle TaxID=49168 RepID=A0ACC0MWM7_RHOML|nr:hypothetical protein RHMOL_Rhmol07G0041100 [Rhododendron molle]